MAAATQTPQERTAYHWLPQQMRRKAERFIGIAFEGYHAYYPDMLFRELKIDLEIDGKFHDSDKRKEIDPVRDQAFIENGYTVVRIKNEDTMVNVAFWERIIETLSARQDLNDLISQLKAMVAEERDNWIAVEE